MKKFIAHLFTRTRRNNRRTSEITAVAINPDTGKPETVTASSAGWASLFADGWVLVK